MANTEQEISWVAARLKEKSTYAGLAGVVSLLMLLASKYFPYLANTDSAEVVSYISMIGIGVGGLLAIVFPEKK